MVDNKTRFGWLVTVATAAALIAAYGAERASASSRPIVIQYAKTCDETTGICLGTAGDGGTIAMQVTGFTATGKAAHLTMTERITVGTVQFDAALSGVESPDGFIVLNGTVTKGSFAGSQVHQRSDFAGLVGGDPNATAWAGELQLTPASA